MTHPVVHRRTVPWARPVLAYLVGIAALDAVIYVVEDPSRTGSPTGAIGAFVSHGPVLGAILAGFLLPAVVLTLHGIARPGMGPPAKRAVIGAAAWVGWYLVVAAAVVLAGTIGLWPEGFYALLVLLGGAGGLFGLLLGERPARPSRAATIVGVTVGVVIIAGCFITAGGWGRSV